MLSIQDVVVSVANILYQDSLDFDDFVPKDFSDLVDEYGWSSQDVRDELTNLASIVINNDYHSYRAQGGSIKQYREISIYGDGSMYDFNSDEYVNYRTFKSSVVSEFNKLVDSRR